jgi:putative zinc finger protein
MAKHPVTALIPYLRQELAAGERAFVALHLEQCAECRDLMNSLAEVSADLARLVEQIPAPDPSIYRAQLARKLAARQVAQARSWWGLRFAWISFATVGAAAIALILMLSLHRQPFTPSVEEFATENGIFDAGLGLLRDYPVVSHLDLLENYDVIEHLDELSAMDNKGHAVPGSADLDQYVLHSSYRMRRFSTSSARVGSA